MCTYRERMSRLKKWVQRPRLVDPKSSQRGIGLECRELGKVEHEIRA